MTKNTKTAAKTTETDFALLTRAVKKITKTSFANEGAVKWLKRASTLADAALVAKDNQSPRYARAFAKLVAHVEEGVPQTRTLNAATSRDNARMTKGTIAVAYGHLQDILGTNDLFGPFDVADFATCALDASDTMRVAVALHDGKLRRAYNIASEMDTSPRDELPGEVWEMFDSM